jgi:hypothetical protein
VDEKERSLIRAQRDRIAAGTFGEADVFFLLTLLRPVTAAGTAAHEIANFIAHREKDRGAIRDYLWRTKQTLDSLGKVAGILEIKPVFERAGVGTSLNRALESAGVMPLADGQIDQVLVCVISLLQHVRIVNRGGVAIGELVLARTASEVLLLGKVHVQSKVDAVFPVLVAPNHYVPGPPGETPEFLPLVEATVSAGHLILSPVASPSEA